MLLRGNAGNSVVRTMHEDILDLRRQVAKLTEIVVKLTTGELNNDVLLSTIETGKLLSLSTRTVSLKCRNGEIPCIRRGNRYFIKKSTIDKIIRQV